MKQRLGYPGAKWGNPGKNFSSPRPRGYLFMLLYPRESFHCLITTVPGVRLRPKFWTLFFFFNYSDLTLRSFIYLGERLTLAPWIRPQGCLYNIQRKDMNWFLDIDIITTAWHLQQSNIMPFSQTSKYFTTFYYYERRKTLLTITMMAAMATPPTISACVSIKFQNLS